MGWWSRSRETLRRARAICAEVHDDTCAAATFRIEGNQNVGSVDYENALRLYRQGLPLVLKWQNRAETARLFEGFAAAVREQEKMRLKAPEVLHLESSEWLTAKVEADRP